MANEKLLIFGNHLRELRLTTWMTQEALGDRAGLHPTYIGGIERGERNLGLSNLLKLATALDVQPSILLAIFD